MLFWHRDDSNYIHHGRIFPSVITGCPVQLYITCTYIYHVGSYVCLLPFSQVCVLVRISRALACPVFAKAVKKDLLRIVKWGKKLRLFRPNFFHLLNSLRGELNTIVTTLFTMFEKIFICTVKVLIIILHLTAPGLPHFKLKLHSALGPGLAFRTTSSLSQSLSLSLTLFLSFSLSLCFSWTFCVIQCENCVS